jgi:hypothetical protein
MALTPTEELELRAIKEKFVSRLSKFAKRDTYGYGKACEGSSYSNLLKTYIAFESLESTSCQFGWDNNPDGKRCVIDKLLKN